jgi:[ribosomal protein S5]-alanine N-acetyltransferase
MYQTKRLRLEIANAEQLAKLVAMDYSFIKEYGITLTKEYTEFVSTTDYSLDKVREHPFTIEWHPFLIIHKEDKVLLGIGGYKGPSNINGDIEICYGIIANYRSKGYATEAAQWFIEHAFENEKVKIVSATTLSDNGASSNVLRKCGMLKVGRVFDFEHGKLWKWEITRKEFAFIRK